jgi:O-antigen/teichoic acid export membrane protein
VVAAWTAPREWLTPLNVSIAFAALQGVEGLAYLGLGKRIGAFRRNLQITSWPFLARDLARQSLPFYWLALLTAATNQLPIIFLAQRSGQAQVGLYNVAYRLMSPMQVIIISALSALYPGLSRAGVQDEEGFMRMARRALVGITLLGTVGATVVSLLRQEIVTLLYGGAYRATADALLYQSWYTVIYGLFCLIGTSLAARDKQKWLAVLSTCYAVVAIPILWIGAGYGATGLAAGILAAAAASMTYHWVAFGKCLPRPTTFAFALRPALVLVSGMIVSWAIPQSVAFVWRLCIATAVLLGSGGGLVHLQLSGPGSRLMNSGASVPVE